MESPRLIFLAEIHYLVGEDLVKVTQSILGLVSIFIIECIYVIDGQLDHGSLWHHEAAHLLQDPLLLGVSHWIEDLALRETFESCESKIGV